MMRTALIIVLAIAYGAICWGLGVADVLKRIRRICEHVRFVDEDGQEKDLGDE